MNSTEKQRTPSEALGYILGLVCGFVQSWSRPVRLGVGLTLMLACIVLFWMIHRIDPGDSTPGALLIGSSFFVLEQSSLREAHIVDTPTQIECGNASRAK